MPVSASTQKTTAEQDDLVKLARSQAELNYYDLSPEERQEFDYFFWTIHLGWTVFPVLAGPSRSIRAEWIRWVCKDPAVKLIQPSGLSISDANILGRIDLSWLKLEFPLSLVQCELSDGISLVGASVRELTLNQLTIKSSSQVYSVAANDLTVQGSVYLDDDRFDDPVSFRGARITGKLQLEGTKIHPSDSIVTGLDLAFATVDQEVTLKDIACTGTVSFDNVDIRGNFHCYNMTIASRLGFRGTSMKVSGTVTLNIITDDPLYINRSTIGGDLVLAGREFLPENSPSSAAELLEATEVKVDGDVHISLQNTTRGIFFFGAKVGGSIILLNAGGPTHAILELTDASARSLFNNRAGWPRPGNLGLQGFVFNELDRPESNTQIAWLRLQSPFVSQAYQQMATVLRNMGYREEAVKVQIAEKWDEGSETVWLDYAQFLHAVQHWQLIRLLYLASRILFYDVLWFFGFGWIIGYGYRPWNALLISIGFVIIGTVVFHAAERSRILIKSAETPGRIRRDRWRLRDDNFSAFIYSLETFIPLVKLGVADVWKINANAGRPIWLLGISVRRPGLVVVRYYRIHIMAGWVFTTLWAAAFTGILKQ